MDSYDPRTARYRSYAAARPKFAGGEDSPRAFLERCIETIEAAEPAVAAFVSLDLATARKEADAATKRWQAGAQRSAVDGLPYGVKDCFDLRGVPTRANCAYFDDAAPAENDAAHVDALRRGGAIVVGKTVTTELTMANPGPTWNPWDLRRTPGGSSSGSAAAVAAKMLPLATGSQVRGSVLRPASICGVLGVKLTYGALNVKGGVDPSPSINHLGFLGGTLSDIWDAATHIGATVGGDPGYPAFSGGPALPPAKTPLRLLRQYTAGWPLTDDESKARFEDWLGQLRDAGIEIVEPASAEELALYERATAAVPDWFFNLMLWEMRWPVLAWRDRRPDAFSDGMLGFMDQAARLTAADYDAACTAREELRVRHRALAGKVDGFVSPCHIGPGQIGQVRGTPWYNDASSAIGAPSVSLPLLTSDAAPLGVQIVGFERRDADLIATSRWLLEAFGSPTVI